MRFIKQIDRLLFFPLLSLLALATPGAVNASPAPARSPTVSIQASLPFVVPTLGDLLTFFIRFFFVLSGLMALLFLLLGALSWITSGGSKENVEKAREKIQAAVIGIILIVLVLAIIWTLEKIVFNETVCFGISCPLTIPNLLTPVTPTPGR